MEHSKAILPVSSPSENHDLADADPQIFALLDHVSVRMQENLQELAKIANEIGQSSAEIAVDIANCKETASEKNRILDEEKIRVQRAALDVIEILGK